jgi:signal transduction histidine kinase
MGVVERVRHDLGRPTHPVDRRELPFLVVAAALVIVVAQWNESGSVLDLVLLVVAGAALVGFALLPRVPVELWAAGVVVPVTLAVGRQGHLELSLFLVVTATLYAAWHLGSTLRAAAVAVASCVAIWWASQRTVDGFSWQPWVTAEVFVWVLGRTLFRQRALIAQLEAAREALAVRAVAEERQHIARELHDLAGHTLAAMLLHVTGARHVLRRNLDDAEEALREAERVGRSSMDQIRDTVAALRITERGTDPSLPEASDLTDLVAEYRRAGLVIEARVAPELAGVDGPTATALHRITREALANVARHAPTNHVTICAAADPSSGAVHLRVRDHGRRPPAPPGGAAGFGVAGMRERAVSLGGTLVAEPTADGWVVDAAIPLPTQNASAT